jgi:hypothetical protein
MRAISVLLLTVIAGAGCVRTVVLPPLQNLALRGFVAHADREWPGTPQQQAQTVDTLEWLASAIQSLADTRRLGVTDLPRRIQELRGLIKEFAAGDPANVEQARMLQRAFAAGASLIDDLTAAAGLMEGGARLSAVQQAAEAIDVTRVPRAQAERIERYFQRASEALQRIDRGA